MISNNSLTSHQLTVLMMANDPEIHQWLNHKGYFDLLKDLYRIEKLANPELQTTVKNSIKLLIQIRAAIKERNPLIH